MPMRQIKIVASVLLMLVAVALLASRYYFPTPKIEALLHKTPRPKPTPQLAASLKAAVRLPQPANGSALEIGVPLWRRWFPALAYAVLILGCVVVLAVQNTQQQELLRQNETLLQEIAATKDQAEQQRGAKASAQTAGEIAQLRGDATEADRLAKRLAELQALVATLTAQAGELEAQLATTPARQEIIEPHDFFGATNSALAEARKRSASISCINQLKQIGLGCHIWANDNDGWIPPNFNSMSNELSVVKMLCCPADTANLKLAEQFSQLPGGGWSKWPLNGGSYEFLTPGISTSSPTFPSIVMVRCRIHGHKGMGDGAAIQATTGGNTP